MITKFKEFGKNKLYFLKNPLTSYDYIIVVNNNNIVKGFITRGYQTDDMEKHKINTIGTVYGPKLGTLLYDGLISKYGSITPSSNMSDQAKYSWLKRINSGKYLVKLKKDIGFYSVYKEEEILNSILDLPKNKKIVIEDATILINFDDICNQVKILHDYMSKDFIDTKKDNYTVGESRDRFEWLEDDMKKQNVVMKTHIKEPSDFFKFYKIPYK